MKNNFAFFCEKSGHAVCYSSEIENEALCFTNSSYRYPVMYFKRHVVASVNLVHTYILLIEF